MKFVVLTLFKEMFDAFVSTSIIKRAIDKDIVSIDVLDIRDFTKDKHKRVDFPPPFGPVITINLSFSIFKFT